MGPARPVKQSQVYVGLRWVRPEIEVTCQTGGLAIFVLGLGGARSLAEMLISATT